MSKKIIDEIIFCGKLLYEQGLNHSHSGNLSIRAGDKIFIKKRGAMLGHLKQSDIVKVNLRDNKLDSEASVEVNVHRAIYLGCPEVSAVAHAHTIYATALSFKLKEIIPADSEGKLYLPHIPV
ncbi:MAG: class II aldolase/adducin family protein, partial [Elusimicrobia bacterium]|nr:class II aldolase/adducin family protein [Elusimicrobiota bacterium]